MNKSPYLLALLLAMVLALTGCSTVGGNESDAPGPQTEQSAEQNQQSGAGGEGGQAAEPQAQAPGSDTEINTPEEYLAAFDDADILTDAEGILYAEAQRVNWVAELDLSDATEAGTIARSGVTENFGHWEANLLPEGTVVYRHNKEPSVLIADVDGESVAYLQYVTQ